MNHLITAMASTPTSNVPEQLCLWLLAGWLFGWIAGKSINLWRTGKWTI